MIILIGGADKSHSHAILKNIVKHKKLKKVAIVLSATRLKTEVFDDYKKIFDKMGCDTQDMGKPTTFAAEEIIKEADLIFITGGDQQKLVEKLKGTKIHEILLERIKNNSVVLVGTSAGAMAVSNIMIVGKGEDFEIEEGLGFIDITIDTHFSERNRLGRIIKFLYEDHVHKAIGIDEDTCVLINDRNFEDELLFQSFEISGAGNAYFIDRLKEKITILKVRDEEIKWS